MALRLGWNMLKNKLFGRDVRGGGAAIQGRMLQIALREKLPIYTETPVRDFVVENGRVTGVIAVRGGREVRIQARDGVLINAGGFSRSREMRERFQPKPNPWQWTNANPGDTGEMIEAAMRLGAAIDCMNESWWVITSLGPNESLPEGAVNPEGVAIPFMHHLDLSLPHLIMVDQDGRRFCDESGAYMEIGQRLYARHEATGKGVPAWVILDRRHRENYPWGTAQPGKTPQSWLDSGYMKQAATLEELARLCGIDWAGLKVEIESSTGIAAPASTPSSIAADARSIARTATRQSRQTRTSGRSSRARSTRSRCIPAMSARPAASSPTSTPGFCARTASVIEGLYATGNSTASVVGRCYPGAGSSIGASFVFGYLAAQHAAKSARTVGADAGREAAA